MRVTITKVTDLIYIGDKWDAERLDESEVEFTAVLNLAFDCNDPVRHDVLSIKVGLQNDKKFLMNTAGVPFAIHILRELVSNGHVVLVHCNGGFNRAPYIVSKYFASINCSDWEWEFEKIKTIRLAVEMDWMF